MTYRIHSRSEMDVDTDPRSPFPIMLSFTFGEEQVNAPVGIWLDVEDAAWLADRVRQAIATARPPIPTPATGHTAAPWSYDADREKVIGGDGFPVADVEATAVLPRWGECIPGIDHWSDAPGRAFIDRSDEEVAANGALLAAAPQLLAALRTLIAADNCNYARDTMRHEGLFELGRQAIREATGEDLSRADEGPIFTPAESAPALRDMLSLLLRTVHDTLRHGLTTGQRDALTDVARQASLLLRETPSNE